MRGYAVTNATLILDNWLYDTYEIPPQAIAKLQELLGNMGQQVAENMKHKINQVVEQWKQLFGDRLVREDPMRELMPPWKANEQGISVVDHHNIIYVCYFSPRAEAAKYGSRIHLDLPHGNVIDTKKTADIVGVPYAVSEIQQTSMEKKYEQGLMKGSSALKAMQMLFAAVKANQGIFRPFPFPSGTMASSIEAAAAFVRINRDDGRLIDDLKAHMEMGGYSTALLNAHAPKRTKTTQNDLTDRDKQRYEARGDVQEQQAFLTNAYQILQLSSSEYEILRMCHSLDGIMRAAGLQFIYTEEETIVHTLVESVYPTIEALRQDLNHFLEESRNIEGLQQSVNIYQAAATEKAAQMAQNYDPAQLANSATGFGAFWAMTGGSLLAGTAIGGYVGSALGSIIGDESLLHAAGGALGLVGTAIAGNATSKTANAVNADPNNLLNPGFKFADELGEFGNKAQHKVGRAASWLFQGNNTYKNVGKSSGLSSALYHQHGRSGVYRQMDRHGEVTEDWLAWLGLLPNSKAHKEITHESLTRVSDRLDDKKMHSMLQDKRTKALKHTLNAEILMIYLCRVKELLFDAILAAIDSKSRTGASLVSAVVLVGQVSKVLVDRTVEELKNRGVGDAQDNKYFNTSLMREKLRDMTNFNLNHWFPWMNPRKRELERRTRKAQRDIFAVLHPDEIATAFGGNRKLSTQSASRLQPLMMLSKSYCPFCKAAKRLLRQNGVGFTSIELDKVPDGRRLQDAVARRYNHYTVPAIFEAGRLLGGSDELARELPRLRAR